MLVYCHIFHDMFNNKNDNERPLYCAMYPQGSKEDMLVLSLFVEFIDNKFQDENGDKIGDISLYNSLIIMRLSS